MSLPGVSRQRRMSVDCWRTTPRASSSRRAWSSTGGGDAIVGAEGVDAGGGGTEEKSWIELLRLVEPAS
jgi:hypothetical protein